ncbi:hypothetical protein BJY01DRAFT_13665 [Aspergillus pseudoustus]|uniref:RecF/RecN/SMC N-terminal domain-containing protein n=1 Tax=Aspergillus pseudoustus TaxID=1810923 RepID=A0ABR4JN34_9EURO
MRSVQSHLVRCRQARERFERKRDELRVKSQRKEDRVEELEEALQRESREDSNLEVLQTTLREVEEEKGLNEGQLNDSANAMNQMMQILKQIRQEMVAKDADIAQLKEELRVAESEQHLITDKRRKRISEKNTAVGHIDDMKRTKERLKRTKDETVACILDFSEKANLVSQRVEIDPGETNTSLEKKYERLQRDHDRHNRELGATRDEIRAETEKTRRDHQQALKQVKEFKLLASALKSALKHRKKRWNVFRSHISSRAKAQFTYLLSERSFRGRLLTDHENKLLDLQVEPDITKDSSEGRGARTLSGGEKSFSQVCLLLALWEAMGSPIRCLDEFDVYMDHINRKMAIDMLMHAARRSIGRQFILITPGSRAEITLAPDVRVKELAEPERGQARLSFR